MKDNSEKFGRLQQAYRAGYLISGFIQKTLTREEEEELDSWIIESEENMQLFEDLTDEKTVDSFLQWYANHDTEAHLSEVKKRIRFHKPSTIIPVLRYAIAACVVGLIGVCIYLFYFSERSPAGERLAATGKDILPGSSFAMLKLSDNTVIRLDRDTIINRRLFIKNGEIVYDEDSSSKEIVFHEILIPRKGFYKLVLPDGSRVWLNAASSIRYPSAFTGKDRRVTVTGETYFEVAKDARRPFIVTVNGNDVQALGTKFNINAYSDEADLRTTLIEGSIKISDTRNERILKPGQQLRVRGKEWKLVDDVETSPVTAWVNNEFKLRNSTIEEVMRQVERWYDARIVYTDKIDMHFNGTIGRDVPVSKLLHLLEETGHVHFTIDADTIMVRK